MSATQETLELLIDEEGEEGEAFVTYDIASYPSDLTLSGIVQMWDEGEIVVPDFQRKYVWNVNQASLLIESFLLGLPVPQVFFYVEPNNKVLVIDGQQRILSVAYYFSGFFKGENQQGRKQVFRLTGLDERSPFSNLKYEELPDESRRKLRSSVLRAINIKQLSPKNESTSIYHIFERLNTGGTPLKPQEIRNCVFRGDLIKILRELNKNKFWRQILGTKNEDSHQKDIELLLRIFSLANGAWKKYEKPMKQFLNVAMEQNKTGDTKRVDTFKQAFPKAVEKIVKTFGGKPFHLRGPLNSSALDAVVSTLVDNVNQIPKDLSHRFEKLLLDSEFINSTFYGTSDVKVLNARFLVTNKYLVD